MTRAITPQDINLQIPAAMEGATVFEIYVFMHRDNRTIGQIKKSVAEQRYPADTRRDGQGSAVGLAVYTSRPTSTLAR